ncbi:choice-of-anchor I family protein [Algoriphagus formosus]|uniref:Alkaline phosphatase n=1 Tax=Algoriphagus formosus TaxID=2007308 RepID=A0A4V6PM37_9BACT|nr:choice-of-anchor I family protein [Algoriphagus aquimaris]TDK44147.1 alkaline phosphatase [Algoriphagus aquimaris]
MKKLLVFAIAISTMASCFDRGGRGVPTRINFAEVSQIDIGGEAAAEISTFDPSTNQLFVVNNSGSTKVDIVDFSDPSSLLLIGSIDMSIYGGGVNSVASKNGLLAVAMEAFTKTDNGSVVIFETSSLTNPIQIIPVGALPDMVTFSPNGRYIVTANEGEPNDDYTVDPEGSISIIDVDMGYSVQTAGFSAFEGQKASLMAKGYRVFGPNATLAQDTEPEYVAIDSKSQFAYVTLQENNGVAKVDLNSKTIVDIFPLGVKDHSRRGNEVDLSDRDGGINLQNWPMSAYYHPDAIVSYTVGNAEFFITANEGDARDYDGFSEEERLKDVTLDPTAFPNAAFLQEDENMGRYTITTTAGDKDGDGDLDEIFGFGGRSFTIWNTSRGIRLNDYNKLEKDVIATNPAFYDDGRSDNKGVEPESVEIGVDRGRTYLFVGLERADAVAVYELRGIGGVNLVQILETGDAPEGVLFISAKDSPNGKATLVVSSEGDGVVRVYQN